MNKLYISVLCQLTGYNYFVGAELVSVKSFELQDESSVSKCISFILIIFCQEISIQCFNVSV